MTIPIFPDARTPLVLAHRGDSAHHPENTLAAFAAAARAGADLVELDCRLTADGVPVVLHDADLSRTTDRAGPVWALPLAEVRAAVIPGPDPQRVPTLEEVLELLSGTGTGVDVEIKNLPGEGLVEDDVIVEAVLGAFDRSGFDGPAFLSSFNLATIDRAHAIGSLPTGVLTIGAIPAGRALEHAVAAGHPIVLPEAPAALAAGGDLVDAAHEAGVAVVVWTVDEAATIERLLGWGIDGLATNDPALGVAIRDRLTRGSAAPPAPS